MSHITTPTREQIDLFGDATDRKNQADKVRNAVYPLFKLSYESDRMALFLGEKWQVRAYDTSRSSLDVHKLIETLAAMGVDSPAQLVDGCYAKQTYPSFRATPIPVLA
jgi:hypothetical protein